MDFPSRLKSIAPALFALLMTLFLIFAAPTQTVLAASYVVSKTADTNDGTCDADCSLREAITAANANSGADTITFNATVFPTGTMTTINLTGALPDITTDMNIVGPGSANATVRRNTGGNYRIFLITGNTTTVTISGLTIENGFAPNILPLGGGKYPQRRRPNTRR